MRTFRRLLGLLDRYRAAVVASVLLACAALAAGVAIPYAIGRAVDDIRAGGARLEFYGAAIAALAIVRWLVSVARRLVAGRVSLGVERDLRNLMYAHLHRLDSAFFDRSEIGQLVSRTTADLQSIRFFLGYGLVFAIQSLVTLVVALAVMVWSSPLLTVVALWPAPLLIAAATRFGRRNRPASQLVQQRLAELTAEAEQSLAGIQVVKAHAAEAWRQHRFAGSARRLYAQALVSTRLRAFYGPLIAFLPQLGLATLLVVGAQAVRSGSVTLGEFVAFYGYVVVLSGPMRTLGMALGMAQRAVAAGNRVFEVLDRRPAIVEPRPARPLPRGHGQLELRDVWFGYDPTRPILRGLSLTVEPGSVLGIEGPTGCGKSTLAALVARLYDVDRGAVLLDGVDVRELRLAELRRAVCLASADAPLLPLTLRANVAYGDPAASDSEIVAALTAAGAEELLEELPEGLDTLLGERGQRLSGGQRQRVALARALLLRPRVLILDDPVASVDARTERLIAERIAPIVRRQTTLIVAHRPALLELADRVVALDGGKVRDRRAEPERRSSAGACGAHGRSTVDA